MAKKNTHSELEHLRGVNKALRAENVRLKRQLRVQEKYPSSQDEEMETTVEETDIDLCTHCGKGKFSILDFGKFIYLTCGVCGHREKV